MPTIPNVDNDQFISQNHSQCHIINFQADFYPMDQSEQSNFQQNFNIEINNQMDYEPDLKSYCLNRRRKAIRKPSLERQGGFEQMDENYIAAENLNAIEPKPIRNYTMNANQHHFPVNSQHVEQYQQVYQPQVHQNLSFANNQMATSSQNQMSNNMVNQYIPQQTNHQIQQNHLNESLVPSASVPNTMPVHPSDSSHNAQQNHYNQQQMNNFLCFSQPSATSASQVQSSISSKVTQVHKDSTLKETGPAKNADSFHQVNNTVHPNQQTIQQTKTLQSQDSLASEMVNVNYDTDLDDEQYEENWNKRQAQFEKDMTSGSTTNNGAPSLNERNMFETNQFGLSTQTNGTNQNNAHLGMEDSDLFAKMKEVQPMNVDLVPPSIVISSNDNSSDQFQSMQQNRISSNQNETMVQQPEMKSDIFERNMFLTQDNEQMQVQDFDSAPREAETVLTSAIRNDKSTNNGEVKSVKFSEEVETKNVPYMNELSLFSDQPLVVQTTTEGMSRARVRWINAFNKISSHLEEVRLFSQCEC